MRQCAHVCVFARACASECVCCIQNNKQKADAFSLIPQPNTLQTSANNISHQFSYFVWNSEASRYGSSSIFLILKNVHSIYLRNSMLSTMLSISFSHFINKISCICFNTVSSTISYLRAHLFLSFSFFFAFAENKNYSNIVQET